MSDTVITSGQNPAVKEVKALKEKKFREAKGLFFIEGIRFVEEAVKEGVEIEKIIISEQLRAVKGGSEILAKVNAEKYPVLCLSDKVFRELSDTENPQGIMAVVRKKIFALNALWKEDNFFVILDSLQDPGNLGTIIRTADAAGVNGMILSKGCVDLYNPKVLRSTMGSIFHVPVFHSANLMETIGLLKEKGVRIFGAHLRGGRNYFDVDLKHNTALIVGNEANGISDEVAGMADDLVKIPMPGKSESLNASVAASLLMYEAVRQRMDKSI